MANPKKKDVGASVSAPGSATGAHHPAIPQNVRVRHRSRAPLPVTQKEPEAVGYRMPPVHSRFKKGSSGNPKGRPKGARNLKSELLSEISELIVVRENGKTRKVPKLRAYIKRLSEMALQGDLRAILALCTLVRTHLAEPEAEGEADTPLAEEDLSLLIDFARRLPRKDT
jgi:hypothetical protein